MSRRDSLKIPFASRIVDHRLVDAGMTESGIACGCICPGCSKPVMAKHRRKRNTPHFSHIEKTPCPGAFETSLHQAAKQVMAELNEIFLPPTELGPMPLFRFFSTKAEYDLNSIKPDVLAEDNQGNRLAIEMRVTHEVDLVKQEKILRRKLDCIEFDLSKIDRLIEYVDLVARFRQNDFKCHWVHNQNANLFQQSQKELLEQIADEDRQKLAAAIVQAEKAIDEKRRAKWSGQMDWLNNPSPKL